MKYDILNSKLDDVKKLVNRIAKKGGEVIFNIGSSYLKEFHLEDENERPYTVLEEVTEVEIEANFKIEGYTPIALIDHVKDEGNIVTPFSDIKIDKEYYSINGKCDHCNTNRYRSKTVLLQKDNEIKQVGLSCLKEYTGTGLDVSYLAFASQFIRQVEEYTVLTSKDANYTNILDYVASCFRAFKENNYVYVKTRNEWGDTVPDSTRNEGLKVLMNRDFDKSDLYRAEEIIEFVDSMDEDLENNYLTNLKTIISCGYTKKNYLGLLASLVVFKSNHDRNLALEEKKNLRKLSTFQGKVGDRIEVSVSLTKVYTYDSYFGVTYVYEMIDKNNNIYIWKTETVVKDGDYSVKGTIKEHNTYNDINQTILTRCKLSDKKELK